MLEAGDRVGGRVWSERLANGSIDRARRGVRAAGLRDDARPRRAARAHVPREGDALRRPRPARRSTGHARRAARGGCRASRCERRDARRRDRQRFRRPKAHAARSPRGSPSRLRTSWTTSRRRSWPTAPLASALFRATASSAATTGSRAASRLRSTCGSAAASSRSCGATTASSWTASRPRPASSRRRRMRFGSTRRCPSGSSVRSTRFATARRRSSSCRSSTRSSRARRCRFPAASGRGPSTARRAVASFAGTSAALAALDIASGPERWAAAVRRLRPDLPFTDAEPVLATWPGGAYSARSLASPLDDEALARKVGPIAFAGEHTAGEWHGLMEGALRSGLRAAAQCLRLGCS